MSKGLSTKKKPVDKYDSNISSQYIDKTNLEKEISDMETNIKINQNILYDIILNSSDKKDEIKELITQTKKYWKENLSILKNKNEVQKKISILKENIENVPNKIVEELRYYKARNEKNNEEINKQKEKIIKLQLKLKDVRKNNFFQDAKTEVYIISPNKKKNVESNQEISIIKPKIIKLMNIHEKKEKKAKDIREELERLIIQVESLKQKCYTSKNNKSIIDIDKKEVNKFIKDNIAGYDIAADEIEIENESEEESGDADESDEKINNSKSKTLIKKLDKLKEEYKDLKKQCEEYEEKISKYKDKIKNIELKISSLKNPDDE